MKGQKNFTIQPKITTKVRILNPVGSQKPKYVLKYDVVHVIATVFDFKGVENGNFVTVVTRLVFFVSLKVSTVIDVKIVEKLFLFTKVTV